MKFQKLKSENQKIFKVRKYGTPYTGFSLVGGDEGGSPPINPKNPKSPPTETKIPPTKSPKFFRFRAVFGNFWKFFRFRAVFGDFRKFVPPHKKIYFGKPWWDRACPPSCLEHSKETLKRNGEPEIQIQ